MPGRICTRHAWHVRSSADTRSAHMLPPERVRSESCVATWGTSALTSARIAQRWSHLWKGRSSAEVGRNLRNGVDRVWTPILGPKSDRLPAKSGRIRPKSPKLGNKRAQGLVRSTTFKTTSSAELKAISHKGRLRMARGCWSAMGRRHNGCGDS